MPVRRYGACVDEDLDAIVAGIPRMASVAAVGDLADRRLRDGDPGFVAELGIRLWQRYGRDPAEPWQSRLAFDRILRLLTLSSGTVLPALRLISATGDDRRHRYAASLLASAHSVAELAPVLGADAPAELRACLRQELVLRGADVPDQRRRPGTEPTGRPRHGEDHSLDWLPSSLRPVEGRPDLPHYTLSGSSCGRPLVTGDPVRSQGPAPAARETTTAAVAARIGAAVANWPEHSNGRVEARTFLLDAELCPGAVAGTLASTGVECVQSLTSEPESCTPAQVWPQLFTAASAGGAYGGGAYGAYGRLLAWRSAGALAGAAPDASAADVEAAAHGSAWYSFAGASDWFDRVAWDIGLAVVSPDGRHLAVLAATDTD